MAISVMSEEAWLCTKRNLVKIVPVKQSCGGFIIEAKHPTSLSQHPIKGRFLTEADCEAAIAQWIADTYDYQVYLAACQKRAELLQKRATLTGLEYLTTEPGYWLNRLPDNWECVGRSNGNGVATLYLAGTGEPPNWSEDIPTSGFRDWTGEWTQFITSVPEESKVALSFWDRHVGLDKY
jgi:hypothetical protein